jgi:hypothetical protein
MGLGKKTWRAQCFGRLANRHLSVLQRLFRRRGGTKGEGIVFRVNFFKPLFQTIVVIFSLAVILTPVGTLYLAPLSKAASFGVVVGFVVMFTISMIFVMGNATDSTLIALSAYMAVLVTFLGQLAMNGNCGLWSEAGSCPASLPIR